jgi:hypothetical protein
MYDLQACIADWNAGALTDTPLTFNDGPEPERSDCWIASPPEFDAVGSGKFDTPWERMHFAKAIASEYLEAEEVLDLLEPPQADRNGATATRMITG